MKAKNVRGKMNLLGRLIWQGACERVKSWPHPIHPIELISEGMAEGEKTARRLLNGVHHPTLEAMISLDGLLKYQPLHDHILIQFRQAFDSKED